MVDLKRIWASAELAQASYAKLGRGTNSGENEAVLTDVAGGGMTSSQAKEFSRRIPTVLLPYDELTSGGSSFSATLFKDAVGNDPGNLTLAIRGKAEQFARTVNQLKGKVTMLFIAHQVPRGLAVDDVVTLDGCSKHGGAGDSTQTGRGG